MSRLILPAGAALLASLAAPALGQQPGLIRAAPAAEGPPSEKAPARREARIEEAARSFWEAVKLEATRYARDSAALLTAPLRWDARDRQTAGSFVLLLGGLILADEEIDRLARRTRSDWTDRVSAATTSLGGGDGPKVSAGLLLGGLLLRDREMREMGRDALEAGVLARTLQRYVLKPAFGRERPEDSDGDTAFRPFSGDDSFPSAHATQVFCVASVIAMRARGWILPTLAYAAATVVAFDRVNDRAHFASDVFAGAVFGTAVGRFLVSRHRAEEKPGAPEASLRIIPIRGGLAARLEF